MAAIYSGIHLKLKSAQTPWEDKLKLARFAWISTQCLLPNKEQLLLDWCTHALTGWYNQKVEFSQNVLEGLWCYLDDLLHSRKLHSLLKQGKSISLRLNMAQLLLDRLQECACVGSKSPVSVSTILSVCRGLFSFPALSSVFTTKYELMVDLLAKLCCLCCRELQQPAETLIVEDVTCQDEVIFGSLQTLPECDLDCSETNTISESPPVQLEPDDDKSPANPKENSKSVHLFDVLLQVLSCYVSVQRQQANPNRVFTMVTNQLIQNLVLLRHLLTSGEFSACHTHLRLRQQLCKDVRAKIDSILQLALFPSEHLSSYKEELLPPMEDSGKRGHGGAKGPLKPVTTILAKLCAQGYCEAPLHYTVKSTTLSLLFKFFLDSYRKERGESEEGQRMLCFYFLTRLVSALDVGLDGQLSSPAKADKLIAVTLGQTSSSASPCSPESWSVGLLTLESLLNQALSADIYNVAADRIRHKEVQLSFYRSTGQMLFDQAQPSIPSWYRCLRVLLSLNHLILDPDLDELLSSAWVNSDCMEMRVQRARQHMVGSLLQTYTKLRQLPRLFSELLSVICQPALDHLRPPLLSAGVSSSLRTCILDTPPSQVLEICSLVMDSIRKYILPDLVKEEEGVEKMEIGGGNGEKWRTKETRMDAEREDASLKLFSLVQLLHVGLFSVKTLDNTTPLPIVRQSQSLMKEIQQAIIELVHAVSTLKKDATASTERTPKKGKRDWQKVSESKVGPLWEQKTQEAALLLQYTWVEVDTLFSIHCSKYTALDMAPPTEDRYPVLSDMESLTSGRTAHLQSSCSAMSRFLLKLLTLQRMKKTLLDSSSLSEPSTAALLNRAAQFILAKSELEASLNGEQVWDGQTESVNTDSYHVAHWYQVTSNLPLIATHLSGQDVGSMADILVSSLLSRQKHRGKDCPPGSLTISHISSQLLQSPAFAELPSLFSATVHSLIQRIVTVFKVAHVHKVRPTLLKEGAVKDSSLPSSTSVEKETIVNEILASLKTGEVAVLMTGAQIKELVDLLKILAHLNPDGMNSEDLSSVFLLLLYTLTSTSIQLLQEPSDLPESRDDAAFLVELLRILTCLSEGRNFQSVLKLIHGGTLLQAVVSSLLCHSSNGRFRATGSADWLDLIKAVQGFIRCLTQLIITRNSSVRLNLDQLACYLTGTESRQIMDCSGDSIFSVHLMLASLTSFSQTMSSNLGRSKPLDQTLAQMLTRMTASLRPAVEGVLKLHTGSPSVSQPASQPASILSQAFVVEVVTVMLHCELSSLSVEKEDAKPDDEKLSHMSLYQGFCQQILKEISLARRPMDFLKCSLHFLSTFYKALNEREGKRDEEQDNQKEGGEELDELYMQILQTVHRLLTASWQSSADICQLEPAVQELLHHLVEKCTTGQFNLLLLLIKEGLNGGYLRAGNYREVLSAVIVIKLLSCCRLPERCSKSLWLFVPQIISTMVLLVRTSSQDASLTLPFTVPTVTSMTSLLRQGEGLITNPQHVITALGALQAVPLDHLSPPVYQAVFLAIHEALFAIIQCHPQVMLNAAPSFLNVFHRLVASIMQEGRQRGEADTGPSSDVYLQCSRLIERMYSHIAATAESFTTLSAFMVAQYVTELQKVTLRPDIKLHLTEGIYQILDLCMEQDIKFLTAGLQTGVREVFNELYGSYSHYHKAQRQGEDKYTV